MTFSKIVFFIFAVIQIVSLLKELLKSSSVTQLEIYFNHVLVAMLYFLIKFLYVDLSTVQISYLNFILMVSHYHTDWLHPPVAVWHII